MFPNFRKTIWSNSLAVLANHEYHCQHLLFQSTRITLLSTLKCICYEAHAGSDGEQSVALEDLFINIRSLQQTNQAEQKTVGLYKH